MTKTPDEWLKDPAFAGIQVYDADGWDRKNFEESWAKPITKQEMWSRLAVSTISIPKELMR